MQYLGLMPTQLLYWKTVDFDVVHKIDSARHDYLLLWYTLYKTQLPVNQTASRFILVTLKHNYTSKSPVSNTGNACKSAIGQWLHRLHHIAHKHDWRAMQISGRWQKTKLSGIKDLANKCSMSNWTHSVD